MFDFVRVSILCVGAGTSTLMSISERLARTFFRRKKEKTQPMREKSINIDFIRYHMPL